jgi:Protein of unknown function (DUF3606)
MLADQFKKTAWLGDAERLDKPRIVLAGRDCRHGLRGPDPIPRKPPKAGLRFIWRKPMDDLNKKGAVDRGKINMHEDYEVKHWTKQLGVSKEELQKAVDKVGNSAAAVRKELGR